MTADAVMALIVVPVLVMGGIPAISLRITLMTLRIAGILLMTLRIVKIPQMMRDLILQTTAENQTVRMTANRTVPLQIPEDLQRRAGNQQKTGYSGV